MIRGPGGRFKAVNWRDALAVVLEIAHRYELGKGIALNCN